MLERYVYGYMEMFREPFLICPYLCPYLGAKKALLVSFVSALLAKKMSDPWEHPVRGRMAQNVKVEETVCVAGVSAIQQRVEKVTMVTSANVMMNTVRSSKINCVEVEF